MANAEIETIIGINEADRAEGYFSINTSNRSHAEKILRRIGGEKNALNVTLSRRGNVITYWSIKVPIKYLSKSNFGIKLHSDRPKKPGPKNPTWLHKKK